MVQLRIVSVRSFLTVSMAVGLLTMLYMLKVHRKSSTTMLKVHRKSSTTMLKAHRKSSINRLDVQRKSNNVKTLSHLNYPSLLSHTRSRPVFTHGNVTTTVHVQPKLRKFKKSEAINKSTSVIHPQTKVSITEAFHDLPRATKTYQFYGRHLREKYLSGKRFVTGRKTSLLRRSPTPVVPNIVHYVWFGRNPLRFHHMLSMISAYKFIKPERIIIHCDHEPTGKWWKLVKKNITTLTVRHVAAPREIFGHPVYIPEHQSDVARLDILTKYGGIYLDFDVFALRSFEELLHYEFTMGIEYHSKGGKPGRLNSGIVIASGKSRFLKLWYETFHYFNANTRNWDHQSCIVTYYMQYEFPRLIHVEEKSLNYPSGLEKELIYDQIYDWSQNYAMHLWYRFHKIEHTPQDIKHLNTTFGQMARYIFYDSKKSIK